MHPKKILRSLKIFCIYSFKEIQDGVKIYGGKKFKRNKLFSSECCSLFQILLDFTSKNLFTLFLFLSVNITSFFSLSF